MEYKSYIYLYPPRPEQTTQNTELGKYDNGNYIAQVKSNGDCTVLFLSDKGDMVVMNRHKGTITSNYSNIDLKGLQRGKGWTVLCGEMLNKSKYGEDGKLFNQKFVIWDILVHESKYLLGWTVEKRLELLEELYPCSRMRIGSDGKLEALRYLCSTDHENVYRAPSYYENFESLYHEVTKTDVYEGLVLKRKDAKLTLGMNSKNNHSWQIKSRKPTKNYSF